MRLVAGRDDVIAWLLAHGRWRHVYADKREVTVLDARPESLRVADALAPIEVLHEEEMVVVRFEWAGLQRLQEFASKVVMGVVTSVVAMVVILEGPRAESLAAFTKLVGAVGCVGALLGWVLQNRLFAGYERAAAQWANALVEKARRAYAVSGVDYADTRVLRMGAQQ